MHNKTTNHQMQFIKIPKYICPGIIVKQLEIQLFWRFQSFNITLKSCSSESSFSNQILKLIWESDISFYAGLSKCLKMMSENLILSKKNIRWSNFYFKPMKLQFYLFFLNHEFRFLNQLFKLIWVCGIGFSDRKLP